MRFLRPSVSKASSMKRRLWAADQTLFRSFQYDFLADPTVVPSRYNRSYNVRLLSSKTPASSQKSHRKKKKRHWKTPKKQDRSSKSSKSSKARRNSKNRTSGKKHHKNDSTTVSKIKTNRIESTPSIANSIVDQWDGRERLWNRSSKAGTPRLDTNNESLSSSSSRARKRSHASTFQLDRFLEKQQEFCDSLGDYRTFWYPASEKQQQETSEDWKNAMDFHHPNPDENFPWLDLSWDKLVESEDLFRRVCSSHHELFVSCSSYLTDLSDGCGHLSHHHSSDEKKVASAANEWTDQDFLRAECEDLLAAILPSWERLRRERALLVEAYRPPEEFYNDGEPDEQGESVTPQASRSNPTNQEIVAPKEDAIRTTTPDVSYESNQWVGWLKGMIAGNDQIQKEDDSDQPFEKVTAHLNPECAPNHYHYTKLVGRLYFHYLPLELHNRSNPFHLYSKTEREAEELENDKIPYKQALANWEAKRIETLGKRAEQMQYIVDQSLLPLTPNRNNNGTCASKAQHHQDHDELSYYDDTSDRVLTDKIVRLLIRSYLDMESLSAAQKAERVYHKHPNHRKRLLWYVTMCYLKVITTNKKELARAAAISAASSKDEQQQQKEVFLQRNKECAAAAKRICELVSSKHAKEAREFQHCSTIAFEALAILPQYGRRGLKGYYDRVHSLGILKFGPKVWEALLKSGESTSSSNQPTNASSSSSRRRKRKTNRKSSLAPSADESPTQQQGTKEPIDLSQSLHSKDHRILNYLIQIYSHEEKDLPRALRLLEVSLDLYPSHDLRESLDRSTFHKLLRKLSEQRRKAHVEHQKKQRKLSRNNTSANNEFDTALGLLDHMVSEESWFPTEETFRILFSMIPYCDNPGRDAERMRFKLEACRFLSGTTQQGDFREHENSIAPHHLLNPLEASTLTLRAWLQTLQQNGGNLPKSETNPSQRALAILKGMKVKSSTLFPPVVTQNSDSNVETEARVSASSPPTAALYSLALQVCSRDSGSPRITLDTALDIFELLRKDDLLLEESSCLALLEVLANFSDNASEDQRDILQARANATKRVCEALADEDPQYGQHCPSILEFLENQASYLRLRHPDVYEEHLAGLNLLEGTSE